MGAFTKCGRIAVAASSVAVLSMNTALLESPKPVEQTNPAAAVATAATAAAAPPAAPPAAQEKKLAEKQSVCRKTPSSKAPKMAPQFDGLNFYETFIGAAQR
jgi:hypothetical protein